MGAAALAAAVALHLLALYGGAGPSAAAARPLGRHHQQEAATSSGTRTAAAGATASALEPAGHQRRAAIGDAAARAGKWLPYAGVGVGVHHLPAAFWARRHMPWGGAAAAAAGAPPALGLGGAAAAVEGEEGEPVRERPYVNGGTTTTATRQEQLAMWASLLNPKGKGRPASSWLPAPGTIGEAAADEEQDKASVDGDAEGTAEVDGAAAGGGRFGRTKSEFDWGNNGK
ncbi:hypothetical protein ACP4OV_007632 [Aristida adscensionis]